MRLSQLTQPIKEGNYPEPRKMQVTQADKEANTEAWKRFKAGDPRYEWHDSNLKEFGPDERYIKVGNTTGIANKKTGGIVAHTKIGNTKVSANNHMNADGTQGNINATGKIAGVKVKASNNLKGTNPKLKVNDLTVEGYNDDEWSDKEKENLEYTVWVGGTEVNDHWLTYDEAKVLYDKFKAQGYDDIQLDARIKQEIPTDSKLISKEFHGIDWDKINEESEEEKYEKLEVAYGHGGEAGLAKALGMTEPQLNDIIDELAAESHEWARQVLTADDDRDVIIDRIMDLAADGRYDDYHTSKWDEAYNPETGRDPNVDTTEWDNLIAKAKKKQGISDEEEVWFNYEDIGGNIIVNPKSTIEDQIAELLNRYYDISPMEFDPSKIEIQNEAGIFAPLVAPLTAVGAAIPAAIGRAVIGGVARAVGGNTIIGPPPLAIARSVTKKIKDRLGSEDDEEWAESLEEDDYDDGKLRLDPKTGRDAKEKYIVGWSLVVEWSDELEPENITDIRGDVAQVIDDYLSEIEYERAVAEGVYDG